MSDSLTQPQSTTTSPIHQGIMQQTLGEILQNNKQAQNLIMNAMGITPEKFQEMLKSTENNPLMQQTIGELFKNGTMQQAAQQGGEVSPEQMQHIVNTLQNNNAQTVIQGETISQSSTQQETPQPTKPTFFQKLTNLFK